MGNAVFSSAGDILTALKRSLEGRAREHDLVQKEVERVAPGADVEGFYAGVLTIINTDGIMKNEIMLKEKDIRRGILQETGKKVKKIVFR